MRSSLQTSNTSLSEAQAELARLSILANSTAQQSQETTYENAVTRPEYSGGLEPYFRDSSFGSSTDEFVPISDLTPSFTGSL